MAMIEMTQNEWMARRKFIHSDEHQKSTPLDILMKEEEEIEGAKILPEVGGVCTQILWSDCYAYTITRVITNDKIAIRKNDYKIKNYYDGEGEILPTLVGGEKIITRRKNGHWYDLGAKVTSGAVVYTLKYARTYRDPSF